MSTSSVAFAVGNRRKSSRRFISHNLFGGAAVACLVLGCGWTVYTHVIAASVYPTLGSAGYDEPVIKPSPRFAARSGADAIKEAFAALPAQASLAAAPTITPGMFNERFAASEPNGVPSRATDVAPPPAAPKLAEAAKAAPKLADAAKTAPRLADAAKPKDAPAQLALNVPPSPSRPVDATPAKSAGTSIRDMAQRAKNAVLSIAANERMSITEKLWGKEPSSHGSLLAYASADASVTGSIGREPNPVLGGSPPYDRDTAVYDITAHMVYLPDGSKLEAHSGLGSELDDPRSARIRMRGVTPPHIYELKPREALFHGVPALRLNPIGGEEAIYGRSGLLAHTFMLGPNGDSNGCVSFKDYNAFLNAYRNQGIKKLAVVARVD
jgi:Protein of unknown function (DUF2778)